MVPIYIPQSICWTWTEVEKMMLASPRGSIGGQEERSTGERNGDALECRLCIKKNSFNFSPAEDAKILAKNKMTIKRSYSIEVSIFILNVLVLKIRYGLTLRVKN